jgi:hypothetical protein
MSLVVVSGIPTSQSLGPLSSWSLPGNGGERLVMSSIAYLRHQREGWPTR